MKSPSEISPPSGARSQPGRKTIAVLLDYVSQFVGSYEAQLRDAFDARGRELDLNLILVYGGALDGPHGESVAQNAIFELMHPDRVDGLILLSTTLASFCGIGRMQRFAERYRDFPLCSIGLELAGIPSLVVDNRRAMERVVEHVLVDHGCRRPAFIGGMPENTEAQLRADAYRRVLTRHGIAVDPALMVAGYFVGRGGYDAVETMLARRVEFDAVIAANDGMALGAILALRQHGFRVPRDLPVTGFDDLAASRAANPPLTTVAQPFQPMAERAVQLVLEQLMGRAVPACTELAADLVVRRSCGCARRTQRTRLDIPVEFASRAGDYLREHASSWLGELAGLVGVGARDGQSDAARLLDALRTELDGAAESFVRVVEDILEETDSEEQHCQALQNAIRCLREHFRSFATPELEDLWHDTHSLIELTAMRSQLQHRFDLDDSYMRLLDSGEQVAGVLDVPSLKQALCRTVPSLGMPTVFISRHPEDKATEFEPLVCLLDGVPVDPPSATFPAHLLFPPGIYRPERRFSALVMPVVVANRRLGAAVFEYSPGTFGYQMVRDQIAGALSSIRLHQAVMEQTMLHQRITQEREATFRRMESLSVLAGGVAHDLNNALGPLVALPDVMRSELEQLDPRRLMTAELRTDLDTIKSGALHAAQTIKDLLTLSRRGRTAKQRLDLNRTVADCLNGDSLRFVREANPEVRIVLDLGPDTLHIQASEAHLTRALMNLVRNAVEAIPGEGEVVVRTFGTLVLQPTAGYETVDPGDYAVVTVADSGTGIVPEDLARVFEPFFTRKRVGEERGSGLGLAIVHGVVKEHEGFVDVTSKLSAGTTFTLYFPRVTSVAPAREEPVAAPRQRARILLVDDDAVQLRSGSRLLGHLGYQVETRQTARETDELFSEAARAGKSPCDLVILDMILDGEVDGLELFERIRSRFPEQKAILISGHVPTERTAVALEQGLAWLAKPYTLQALAQAVAEALSGQRTPTVVRVSSRPPLG
jgi:DNA-binding LacI/PurR family transcriptional regulator/signal transduction histidine kinase/ActR/RegA family two-component response regulator